MNELKLRVDELYQGVLWLVISNKIPIFNSVITNRINSRYNPVTSAEMIFHYP